MPVGAGVSVSGQIVGPKLAKEGDFAEVPDAVVDDLLWCERDSTNAITATVIRAANPKSSLRRCNIVDLVRGLFDEVEGRLAIAPA